MLVNLGSLEEAQKQLAQVTKSLSTQKFSNVYSLGLNSFISPPKFQLFGDAILLLSRASYSCTCWLCEPQGTPKSVSYQESRSSTRFKLFVLFRPIVFKDLGCDNIEFSEFSSQLSAS